MILLEKQKIVYEGFGSVARVCQPFVPLVKAAAANTHARTEQFNAKLCREFIYYFEFLLFKGMNSLFAPSPFTM